MQLISLGSSVPLNPVGPPKAIVRMAVGEIQNRLGPIRSVSRLYGTRAWPDPNQPSFVNAVISVESALPPLALLDVLLDIERAFGRTRGSANAPRTLDLDFIADGDRQLDTPGLTLPHPRLHARDFVLTPLCDIWPDWMHPGLGRTAQELLVQCINQPEYDASGIWVLDGGA